MKTSLHGASVAVDDLETASEIQQASEEDEHHVHLPNPSLWPALLSVAILVTVAGLLFIPDNPWLSIVAAPFIVVGIMGWALEDPMGGHEETREGVAHTRTLPLPPTQVILDEARQVARRVVTVASTAYSTHPIKVELENEGSDGIVVALYGKVELQAQREELEEAVHNVYGVSEVKNFVVAEDAILNIAYKRLDNLIAQGKLDGAQNISILVENYILHLYGDVPTSKMKFDLEREMIGIPGVTVVVNHIGLNKDIPGNLGKTRNKVGA